MMNNCRIAIFALFIAAHSFADKLEEAPPAVRFEEFSHDFGKVYSAGVYTKNFVFYNDGDSPLEFKKIKTSCHCMYEVYSGLKLSPGGKGKIKVGYDLRGQNFGHKNDTLLIETNDPGNRLVTLSVSIDFKSPVEVVPDAIHLGLLEENTTASATFTIHRSHVENDAELQVPTFSFPDNRLSVITLGTDLRGNIWTGSYRLVYKPDGGRFKACSVIIRTHHSRVPILELPITAANGFSMKLEPPRVLFGIVNASDQKSISIDVTSHDAIIVDAYCPDERIATHIERLTEDGRYVLMVQFTPKGNSHKLASFIELRDKDGNVRGEIKAFSYVRP